MRDGSIRGHLFIVLIDPTETDNLVLVATCSTIRSEYFDKTTILKAGCHPFITEDSFIRHYMTDVMSVDDINNKIQGNAEMRDPIDNKIVDQILADALKDGGQTRRWVKRWYQEYLDDRMFDAI